MNDDSVIDDVVTDPNTAINAAPSADVAEAPEPVAGTEVPLASLTVKRAGVLTEERFVFAAPAVVGRFDPEVGPIDIDLGQLPEGAYVSRRHARLTHDGSQWLIEDLGSSNGTFVLRTDFERAEGPTPLVEGDEIALGNARLVFGPA